MSLDLSKNYFELFELPIEYAIDEAFLSEQYRKLQGVVHPDRHMSGLDAEKNTAIQNAAYVNQAYRTLKDSLLRASYLLNLKSDNNSAGQAGVEPVLPADFLMEQMEFREELENIATDKAAEEKLANFSDEIDQRRKMLEACLKKIFEKKSLSDSDVNEIKQYIQKLQYFNKLLDDINALQFEIEDQ